MQRWMFLCAAAFLFVSASAHATIVKVLEIDELTVASDVVVDGTVTRVAASWTPDHQGIYTDVDIELADSIDVTVKKRNLKAGQTVTIRQAGGELDGQGFRVIGAPEFEVGERVVLFLQEIQGLRIVVGLKQGKLPVVKNPKTGQLEAQRDLSGLAVVTDDGIHKHGAPGDEAGDQVSLADLKQRIQNAADAKRNGEGE